MATTFPTGPHRTQWRGVLAALGVASLPVIVAITLAALLFHASPRQALPVINDEVAYWNQIATFAAAGFGGGYIVVDEHPSRLPWSHFGPHGPGYAVLYGIAAKVFGWGYSSGPVYGAVAFIAAATMWIVLTDPPLIVTALLFASFWPLINTLPTTMQEALHFAIGCALAPFARRLLADDDVPHRTWIACLAVIAIGSLVRPVWALLALPLGWYAFRRRGWRAAFAGLIGGAAVAGALYFTFMTFASPFPRQGSPQLSDFVRDPREMIHRVVRRATVESPEDWFSADVEPLERLNRVELMALAVLACALSLTRGIARGVVRVDRFTAWALALLIGSTLAIGNIGGWTDFRATTPVLLLLLLLYANTRPALVWIVAAIHIVATPVGIATFRTQHGERFNPGRIAAVDEFAAIAARHIGFDPTLPSWGNTVLVNATMYQTPILGLPRGIGASAVAYWTDVTFPLHSRYVILSPSEVATVGGRVRLRKLADTSIGQLFENLDWH